MSFQAARGQGARCLHSLSCTNCHCALFGEPVLHETSYNPEIAPDPTGWLKLPEQERLRAVATFHMVHRLKSGHAKSHAVLHLTVENQIAMGFGPAVRAVARLQTQGLSRHDALHAIGSVLCGHFAEAVRGPEKTDSQAQQLAINAALDRLDASTWREAVGG
jgi:hypothetical protein